MDNACQKVLSRVRRGSIFYQSDHSRCRFYEVVDVQQDCAAVRELMVIGRSSSSEGGATRIIPLPNQHLAFYPLTRVTIGCSHDRPVLQMTEEPAWCDAELWDGHPVIVPWYTGRI